MIVLQRLARSRPAWVAAYLLASVFFALLMLCVVDPAFISRPLGWRLGYTVTLAVAFLAAMAKS